MLRNKQEELSEMNVRKEMTEKKLSNLARDNDVATEKLTVIFEQCHVPGKFFFLIIRGGSFSANWKTICIC